jgi:hypothetical protein
MYQPLNTDADYIFDIFAMNMNYDRRFMRLKHYYESKGIDLRQRFFLIDLKFSARQNLIELGIANDRIISVVMREWKELKEIYNYILYFQKNNKTKSESDDIKHRILTSKRVYNYLTREMKGVRIFQIDEYSNKQWFPAFSAFRIGEKLANGSVYYTWSCCDIDGPYHYLIHQIKTD